MNQEIGTKWIEALESGRFRKGKGALHRVTGKDLDAANDEYCCLGVLCRMGMEAGISVDVQIGSGAHKRVLYDGRADILPGSIRKWAGLNGTMGDLPKRLDPEGENSLARVNDREDTFAPVVEAIRLHMQDL